MDTEQFDTLVSELEKRQARNPPVFLWSTGLLAALSYMYLALVLVFCLAVTVGVLAAALIHPNALTIKMALVLGLLFGGVSLAILRALWVKLEKPSGIELDKASAPDLVERIEKLRRQIGSTRFHRVLLQGDYNASVVQIQKLGLFGWSSNYLLLGLPLMQSLTPAEFDAVLAHEFAHLKGGHARFGNGLYRLRRSWEKLIEKLEGQRSAGAKMLSPFLTWFWPRFNARAFVLSRANEYEADALAAKIAGSHNIASALTRIAVYNRHLDESFWNQIIKRCAVEPLPPSNVYAEIPPFIRRGPDEADEAKWLKQAFLINTTTADTHPCLRERLVALNQLPHQDEAGRMLELRGPSAAEQYLGGNEKRLSETLGQEWAVRLMSYWQQRHAETKALAARLRETTVNSAESESAQIDQLWKKAEALAGLEGPSASQSTVDQLLALDPSHAGALFARGAFKVSLDDPTGVGDLIRSMELDMRWADEGLQALGAYYHRNGDRVGLKDIERRWSAHREASVEAQNERNTIELADTYLPPSLSPEQIHTIQQILESETTISAAWCARKQTRYLTDVPMHVLALRVRLPWWRFPSASLSQNVVNRVVSKLDVEGTFMVFVREQELATLGQHLEKIASTKIYEKVVTQKL
jgi:Zn-dependent protease with chaperone function